MPMTTHALEERVNISSVSSSYPSLVSKYTRAGYKIEYSNRLVKTGRNYYDSKASLGAGDRISTAAEELAIQLSLERTGKDPRKASVFDDLFARNESKIYMWQWTDTGLRVPKGRDPNKYETDPQGRKHWARELLERDKVVAEILVPEGNGRVVVEWDEVSGLPKATDDIAFPHTPYTTHFWFNATPKKDSKSGHYDVAVGRRGDWRHDVDERCLDVAANSARSNAYSDVGFRPVRGSAPEIVKSGKPKEAGKIVYL